MIKKLMLTGIVLSACLVFSACTNGTKGYDDVKKAQTEFKKLNSCHMMISSKVNTGAKTDVITTDFTYKMNDKGIMEYCQSQQDAANKLVYCEMGNGEKAEQWLIGNGWTAIEAVEYSKDNLHRYIELLTNSMEKKAVNSVVKDKEDTNTRYTVELNSKELNNTIYKDAPMEVVSQEVSYLINSAGEIICYNDRAVILDKETNKEAEYTLEVQVSEQNTISEIKKPELRANAAVQDVPADDADK